MVPTLNCFLRALLTPKASFRQLHDIEPMITIEGLPALHRTSRFAEVEIRRGEKHYLLSLPLTNEAIRYTEQVLQRLQHIQHPSWTTTRVLAGEMSWQDGCGTLHRCDLVMQELPGSGFIEGLALHTPTERKAMFEELAATLETLGIAHNNLKADNLRVCNGRLIPIRHFDLTTDGDHTRDRNALARLWAEISSEEAPMTTCCDYEAPYTASPVQPTAEALRPNEGLYRFEQEGRFGFRNPDGTSCIAPQFLEAGDFFENRAVVRSATGWGVIDRTGSWVIAPIYDHIDYQTERSLFLLYRADQTALCNYLGEQLTDFAAETTMPALV